MAVARIVAVHGIGNQFLGEHQIGAIWLPALRDGLARAGHSLASDEDLICAFYGDIFRPKGKAIDAWLDSSDIEEGWEKSMLSSWWEEAARVDQGVFPPDGGGKGIGMDAVQSALWALSNSKFFAGVVESVLIQDLKQVKLYLRDPLIRREARQRVLDAITPDTRVLIGHSLGSVVAYEALCQASGHQIQTFVTMGSPLGIRNLIFDQLEPPPENSLGQWPAGLASWINIADRGDVVALVKELAGCFGNRVSDQLIDNGSHAHNAARYLCSKEAGDAVATGI
jgi:hypothetical protein